MKKQQQTSKQKRSTKAATAAEQSIKRQDPQFAPGVRFLLPMTVAAWLVLPAEMSWGDKGDLWFIRSNTMSQAVGDVMLVITCT